MLLAFTIWKLMFVGGLYKADISAAKGKPKGSNLNTINFKKIHNILYINYEDEYYCISKKRVKKIAEHSYRKHDVENKQMLFLPLDIYTDECYIIYYNDKQLICSFDLDTIEFGASIDMTGTAELLDAVEFNFRKMLGSN